MTVSHAVTVTAFSASFGSSVVFAAFKFVDSMLSSQAHTVTFRLARARSSVECGRPPTGGPVPSPFRKELELPVPERT